MTRFNLFFGAALTLAMGLPAAADPVQMDQPLPMGNVEAVCTGIGDAKDDPRWPSYPVRVEFSNGGAQYLAGAHVTLTAGGHVAGGAPRKHHRATAMMAGPAPAGAQLASFDCLGSWVLLKLSAGTYTVTASLDSQPGDVRSTSFATTGAPPQKRVEVQFPLPPNQ